MIKYDEGEEFSYGYSSNLSPIKLLYSYGMVLDDNKFGILDTPFENLMRFYTEKQLSLCNLLGCLDPEFYPDKSKHS